MFVTNQIRLHYFYLAVSILMHLLRHIFNLPRCAPWPLKHARPSRLRHGAPARRRATLFCRRHYGDKRPQRSVLITGNASSPL